MTVQELRRVAVKKRKLLFHGRWWSLTASVNTSKHALQKFDEIAKLRYKQLYIDNNQRTLANRRVMIFNFDLAEVAYNTMNLSVPLY